MDIRERAKRGEKLRMTDDMPWYVTNKDADGFIYRFTVSAWMTIWIPILIGFNAIVWACIGLVVAALTVIHAVAGLL